jgi:predicted ATPase
MIGLDFSFSPHLRDVLDDPRQIYDRGVHYLAQFLEAVTASSAAVLLLEDLHWADDSSLDTLAYLMRQGRHLRLLVFTTARPALLERRPSWEMEAEFGRLDLLTLDERESQQLVAEVLQKMVDVPSALRDLVVSGAEGNPYYVEELIKMLIEEEAIITGEEQWRIEPTRLTNMPVPPTLTGILQARLDRLPPEERTIMQRASVVGRRFWDHAVVRVSEATGGIGEQGVLDGLSILRRREMVFRRDTSAFAEAREYIFKHAILREVTYAGVLKRLRRVCHALVAEWLIERRGERAGEYTGLIADHLEAAGHTERAVIFLQRAGEQAARQYANAEAIAYLSRALDLMPESGDRELLGRRYELLLAREKVRDLQGVRDAQSRDLAARKVLADALADDRRRAAVALRQAHYSYTTADYPAAISAAQAAIDLAQRVKDVDGETTGYLEWGRALTSQGEYQAARTQLEQSLRLARRASLENLEARCLLALGDIPHRQGDYSSGRRYYDQALVIFRRIGDRKGGMRHLARP